MGRFFNNTAHSVGRFGIWIFPSYTPTLSGACWDSRPSVARFDNFYTYGSDMGVEYVVSSSIQFRNLVAFDHISAGIEILTIANHENPNTPYMIRFYNESTGSVVADSLIIGNSDSTSRQSITDTGFVVSYFTLSSFNYQYKMLIF